MKKRKLSFHFLRIICVIFFTVIISFSYVYIQNKDENNSINMNHLRDRRLTQDDDANAYPPDLLITSPYNHANNKWVIIFHFLGIFYMFAGLAIVCDEYFCGALNVMVEKWKVQEDVAGATFMAAGGSAPELFTSIMGVFVAKSDVGFGTVVGSAVFNVLFVIGLCAMFAKSTLKLTWWPLFRDCTCYIIGLSVLSSFVHNQRVEWWEAAILFGMYILYILIMYYNDSLHSYFEKKFIREKVIPLSNNLTRVEKQATKKAIRVMADLRAEIAKSVTRGHINTHAYDILNEMRRTRAGEGKLKLAASFVMSQMGSPEPKINWQKSESSDINELGEEKHAGIVEETVFASDSFMDDDDIFEWPKDDKLAQISFILTLPLVTTLYFTIPNCKEAKYEKYFLVTFFMSLVWISGLSYFMVWWATIIGAVLGIPTTVMGLTFLAAGTSIPDAISSVIMARQGEGDMAISSSIGSNIFDILVGLPIPWLIKTAMVDPGSKIIVYSDFVIVNVLLLLLMVLLVILSIHFSHWMLNYRLGYIMAILYIIFLVISIYLESVEPSWARI